MPDTVIVNSYESENLGTFKMKRRKHKIKVMLNLKDKVTGDSEVPTGAIVSIEGVEGEQVVNGQGEAYFEFVNNSTSNFTLRVRPQQAKPVSDVLEARYDASPKFTLDAQSGLGVNQSSGESTPNAVFVPKTVNFTNEDDNVEHIIEIEVEPGGVLSGKVT